MRIERRRKEMRQGSPSLGFLSGVLPALAALGIIMMWPVRVEATHLVFTIDVCKAWGPEVRSPCKGKDYGLTFLAERLEAYGVRGTFFVNPYAPKESMEEMFSHIRFLVSRGHDVQFHPHLEVPDPSREYLTDFPRAEKKKLFQEGIENLLKAGAPRPIAHRAGAFSIDEDTLSLLVELGIPMDSSIFPPDPLSKVQLPPDLINRFVRIGGPYQLPITLIRRVPFIGYDGMTALDLDRTTWEEQKVALESIAAHKLPVATFFMHFWSLCTLVRTGPELAAFEAVRPDTEDIASLDKVLKLVTTDKRFRVCTARELWKEFSERPGDFEGPSFVPYTGMWLMYLKAWSHFWGHSRMNKVVALAPVLLIVAAMITVTALFARKRSRGDRGLQSKRRDHV
jgi:peptidoglycan/xylan/chitin deacetylase (PgdA/CDA1 family)